MLVVGVLVLPLLLLCCDCCYLAGWGHMQALGDKEPTMQLL